MKKIKPEGNARNHANERTLLIFQNEVLTPPKSIYAFEILRFIAAFITFFGHYVHFFMCERTQVSWFNDINPKIGALAVPSFFMLSGAIFAHTYGNSISLGKTSFFSFIKKRFARLYPLHLLTMILVEEKERIYLSLLSYSLFFKPRCFCP